MNVSTIDELRDSARDSIRKLSRICEDEDIVEAKKLVEELRNAAAYDEMGQLAEAVSRRDPKDAKNRRLYVESETFIGIAADYRSITCTKGSKTPRLEANAREMSDRRASGGSSPLRE